jgi:hypothetical protein
MSGTNNAGAGVGIYNIRLGVNGVNGGAAVNLVSCTINNNYIRPPADSRMKQKGSFYEKQA